MRILSIILLILLSGVQLHSQSEILRETSDFANESIFINWEEFMRGVSTSMVVKENKEVAIYFSATSLRVGNIFYGYGSLLYDPKNNVVLAATENDFSNAIAYKLFDNTLLVMLIKINEDGHVIIKSYGFNNGSNYFDKIKEMAEQIR